MGQVLCGIDADDVLTSLTGTCSNVGGVHTNTQTHIDAQLIPAFKTDAD